MACPASSEAAQQLPEICPQVVEQLPRETGIGPTSAQLVASGPHCGPSEPTLAKNRCTLADVSPIPHDLEQIRPKSPTKSGEIGPKPTLAKIGGNLAQRHTPRLGTTSRRFGQEMPFRARSLVKSRLSAWAPKKMRLVAGGAKAIEMQDMCSRCVRSKGWPTPLQQRVCFLCFCPAGSGQPDQRLQLLLHLTNRHTQATTKQDAGLWACARHQPDM